MKRVLTIIAIFFTFVAQAVEPLRSSYSLNDNWMFFYASEHDSDNARYVELPHTWNDDVAVADHDYRRTTARYLRELYIPAEWSGKRLFLRFGGVQSVADVFVNGRHVGEHRGGYTAFTLEITHRVNYGANNQLLVEVSNSYRNDVLPLSTDQNLYGGIYRDVELLVTGKSIVTPLYYGSDGLFVVQQKVDANYASGVVRVHLSSPTSDNVAVNMRIVAPDGYEVVRRSVRATKIESGRTVEIPFEINYPELWSPASPSLYTVEVSLGDEESPMDFVSVKTGIRKISISEDNKLLINDKPLFVQGVNLAHDCHASGSAMSREQILSDLDQIEDLGANAIRSLGGPHADMLYDECDRRGILAWIDLPLTRSRYAFADVGYLPTVALQDNAKQQLQEIVAQNFNHPSVAMWGLFSLAWQRGDDVVPFIEELDALAHSLDASRPTVGYSNSNGAINFVTDLIVFRQDAGWMKGQFDDVEVWCDQLSSNRAWEALRYAVSYGEQGMMSHQDDEVRRAERGTHRLSERRQTLMHERYAAILPSSGIFWGMWLENMYDFATTRNSYGIDNSGLMDFDHRAAKDAYYLYRAMWNRRSGTLHIAERRWTERRDTLQNIKVYCSTGTPTLIVEGDTVAVREVAQCQYVADSVVVHQRATVRAVDATGGLRDSVGFTTHSLKARR